MINNTRMGHFGVYYSRVMFIMGLINIRLLNMSIINKIPNIRKEILTKVVLNALENNYSALGPTWVKYQMDWLNDIYGSFNNLDKFLIIIYLFKNKLDFYSKNFIKLTYDECYEANVVEIAEFNVSEISKALNIPKESARRNIIELEGAGVISRTKKKIIIDRSSYRFIRPENTIKRVARFISSLSRSCFEDKILPKEITSEQIELVIKENFSYIWKIYYEMQIPMMLAYKKIFKDLETFHIFGTCVVSQHLHSQRENKNKMSRDHFLKFMSSNNVQGINAMSVSDITGIPRATVIRKLQKLVKNKYLVINDKKLYKLAGININLNKNQKIILNHLANFSTKIINYAAHY